MFIPVTELNSLNIKNCLVSEHKERNLLVGICKYSENAVVTLNVKGNLKIMNTITNEVLFDLQDDKKICKYSTKILISDDKSIIYTENSFNKVVKWDLKLKSIDYFNLIQEE